MKDKFILMPVSIEDMEGIENFAALIIRKDNPNVLDIVAEFSNTVARGCNLNCVKACS